MVAGAELHKFILRGQVVSLYRSYIRALRESIDDKTKGELKKEIRREFEAHRGATDFFTIKYLLSDGRTRLKQLHEIFGFRR